ncbi:WXG100 family type VII secretion target [Saccharopolyspora sp. NPDC002376]
MSFSVSPDALDRYADLVSGQRRQLMAMRKYHEAEIAPEMDWGGVLSLLGEVYPAMVGDLDQSISKVDGLLQWSGTGLRETAQQYRDMDQEQAEQLDRVMPGVVPGTMPAFETNFTPLFGETADVAAALAAPGTYEAQFRWQMDILDAIGVSITALVRQLLVSALSYDPFEPILRDWTGDWAKMRSLADVWHNTGKAFEMLGTNVKVGAGHLRSAWSGNAADQAIGYFVDLSDALRSKRDFCYFVRDKLIDAANGASEMFKAASGLISAAIDWAVTASVAAGAGTATVEFYGVGLLGWGVAGFAVSRVVSNCADAANVISKYKNFIEGSIGGLKNISGTSFDGYQSTPLPVEPYSAPR